MVLKLMTLTYLCIRSQCWPKIWHTHHSRPPTFKNSIVHYWVTFCLKRDWHFRFATNTWKTETSCVCVCVVCVRVVRVKWSVWMCDSEIGCDQISECEYTTMPKRHLPPHTNTLTFTRTYLLTHTQWTYLVKLSNIPIGINSFSFPSLYFMFLSRYVCISHNLFPFSFHSASQCVCVCV